jgi:hypothetical protein
METMKMDIFGQILLLPHWEMAEICRKMRQLKLFRVSTKLPSFSANAQFVLEISHRDHIFSTFSLV